MGTADLDDLTAGFTAPDEAEWLALVDTALRGKPISAIETAATASWWPPVPPTRRR